MRVNMTMTDWGKSGGFWTRRFGWIWFSVYKPDQDKPEWIAKILPDPPMQPVDKTFRSSTSAKAWCDRIIDRILWRIENS